MPKHKDLSRDRTLHDADDKGYEILERLNKLEELKPYLRPDEYEDKRRLILAELSSKGGTNRGSGSARTDLGEGITVRKFKPDMVVGEHYRIIKELGRGGMGVVYHAEDVKFEGRREVAIKVLPDQLRQDVEGLELFKEEFLIATGLIHQNICGMYEFLEDTKVESYMLVVEYLKGETLRRLIREKKRYRLEEALPIIEQMACGLDFAHKHGVLHLDMKPSNVMVLHTGEVKIMDFGLSRSINKSMSHVSMQRSAGTPLYMSPEQIDPSKGRKRVTKATDVWSFGITVYEMLSGEVPFQGNNEFQLMQSILQAKPERIVEMPSGSWKVLAKALEKDPQKRYGSSVEFSEALGGKKIVGKGSSGFMFKIAGILFILACVIGLVSFAVGRGKSDEVKPADKIAVTKDKEKPVEKKFVKEMVQVSTKNIGLGLSGAKEIERGDESVYKLKLMLV